MHSEDIEIERVFYASDLRFKRTNGGFVVEFDNYPDGRLIRTVVKYIWFDVPVSLSIDGKYILVEFEDISEIIITSERVRVR